MRRPLAVLLVIAALIAGSAAIAAFHARNHDPHPFAIAASVPSPATQPPATRRHNQHSAPASTAAATVAAARGRSHLSPFQPTGLAIGELSIHAPAVPILEQGGQLEPPADPDQVGWWQGSALAGSGSGTTVLVGHVDSAAAGRGAMYRLDQVKAGTTISTTGAGRSARYRVTSLQYLPKTGGLPASLFAFGGPARLVLITCGGSFDSTEKSYRDNVVVTAVPG